MFQFLEFTDCRDSALVFPLWVSGDRLYLGKDETPCDRRLSS
ncbi:hypothetical protein [Cylindrospermum stagnale]|nr:hypothetical protein [Cylindrospermum stagnale]